MSSSPGTPVLSRAESVGDDCCIESSRYVRPLRFGEIRVQDTDPYGPYHLRPHGANDGVFGLRRPCWSANCKARNRRAVAYESRTIAVNTEQGETNHGVA